MTTADPLSLTEAKRLAANADTILLRATRPADLETPIGAFLRLDDGDPAYLLESVEGGERLGPLLVPRASGRGGCSRSATASPASRPGPSAFDDFTPDLPIDVAEAPDPLDGDPRVRAAPPRPADRGHAALHRRRRRRAGVRRGVDVRADRPAARSATRSASPTAAFIETDLVLVFDHLTHTLSAIASLHTDAPDLEGRYRIAEAAIFEALERTARPTAAEMAARPRARGAAAAPRPLPSDRDRDEPRPRRVHPRRRGRQGRDRGRRGDPGRARPAPVVRPPGRSRDRTRRSTASASTARSAGSTRARTCSSSGRRRSRSSARRPELLLQVEGDRLTTHPIAGTRPRGADDREDALLAEQLQRDPKERAEHVMLVDLGRNDLGPRRRGRAR